MFYNEQFDIKGFIAYNSKRNTIIVSFRGAISTINWIYCYDLFFTKYKYDTLNNSELNN